MKLLILFAGFFFLPGCVGSMNPTGGNGVPDYPYFVTTQPLIIKNIQVPVGTQLVYQEQLFKHGQQDQIMPENKLTTINFPQGTTQLWGGVPIQSIHRFFNTEMTGYTVYADFSKLSTAQQTRFSQLWNSCSDGLGITIKSNQDWSFNKNNIVDVESCSVNYQRYFKNNVQQQNFLNTLYAELMKINAN